MKKVFLFFFIGILSVFSQENNRGYIVNVGEKAPIIEILKESHFFVKKENPVIMLKFTASWCSVCMKEMPVIEKEIWEKHKDNPNFILIALAKDTEKRPQREKEIKLMREKTGATFPIITDYNSKIFELFAEEKAGVTRSIIIDQNGEIAFLTRLFDHDEFNGMKTVIDKLLNKKN
jgi:thiol-disulfide isomerase/thioredoxin